MKISFIRPEDYKLMPWKNGGGSTREVLRCPLDLEKFDWRISIAEVNTSGPFSLFPGCDRSLTLLSGKGMILQTSNTKHRISHCFQPYFFSGEEFIEAKLIDGPCTDFNVIWDRAKYSTEITFIEKPFTLEVDDQCIIFDCRSQCTTYLIPEFENDRTLLKMDSPIIKIKLKRKNLALRETQSPQD